MTDAPDLKIKNIHRVQTGHLEFYPVSDAEYFNYGDTEDLIVTLFGEHPSASLVELKVDPHQYLLFQLVADGENEKALKETACWLISNLNQRGAQLKRIYEKS